MTARFIQNAVLLAIAVLILAVQGCAPVAQAPTPQKTELAREAKDLWTGFKAESEKKAKGPFSAQASINYSGPQGGNRMLVRFFGAPDQALRMDVEGGGGQIYAHLREDKREFIAFVPQDNRAYIHPNGQLGLAAFGIKIPFTMRELALVLFGRIADILPQNYDSVKAVTVDGREGFEYILAEAGTQYGLTLARTGALLSVRTLSDSPPWKIEFAGTLAKEGSPGVPQTTAISRDSGERAVVTVKKFEKKPGVFSSADLELSLPPNAEVRKFDR